MATLSRSLLCRRPAPVPALARIASGSSAPKTFPATARVRAMATATATQSAPAAKRTYEWLVVVPDLPGTLAKRFEVRQKHFEGIESYVQSGKYKMGGALLDEVPRDDAPTSMKMSGSTLVVVAESREEILEILKADIYTRSGVWDMDKVQMWPFKCAFRHP